MGKKFRIYSGNTDIGSIHEDGYEHDPNHKYLIWDKTPPAGFISQAALILIEQFLNEKKSLKEWRKTDLLYTIDFFDHASKKNIKSEPINYKIIAQHLRDFGKFNYKDFNLPLVFSSWLDRSLDININFHFSDDKGDIVQMKDGTLPQEYGNEFPISPILDREGQIFTTFHPQLISRIIKQRNLLVNNSNNALTYDWLFDLRNIINDSISLVDITLNQLYNKAEFAPQTGWRFDKSKLGSKNNRRIKDKFKWIREISGSDLNIEKEYAKFDNLRQLRNHLNHFDPPTLVVTLEEAAEWLNEILYIGQILIKIRKAVGTPISSSLIELVVQKQIRFNPEPAFTKRIPLNTKIAGYKSSIWKNDGES